MRIKTYVLANKVLFLWNSRKISLVLLKIRVFGLKNGIFDLKTTFSAQKGHFWVRNDEFIGNYKIVLIYQKWTIFIIKVTFSKNFIKIYQSKNLFQSNVIIFSSIQNFFWTFKIIFEHRRIFFINPY